MFGVVPKTNCPHVMTSVSPVLNFELTDPCVSCGSTAENWVCLKCSQVLCSRYVAGHMAEHGETSGHPIVFSFSDFSFWCYACDSYITSPVLRPILSACHKAKFGSAAPQTPAGGAQPTGRSRLGVPEDTTEFFDDAATVRAKAHAVADMIRAARHVVVYTGAGISTSAKIPDYRGPQGVWTLRDQGKSASMPITLEQALPTRAHMALKALMDAGLVHYVVSTNVDGLHRRSGLAADQIAELHGNIYREVCATCKTEHLRLFDTTRNRFASLGHQTGRKCEQPGCDGDLCDTIIHFGENLPPIIEDAMRHAGQSDLAIVLGTSMRVAPACHLPTMAADAGHPMVIVNLQRTPYDGAAAVRCFARTDAFMDAVMERLGVAVPEFAGDAMSARGGDDAPSGDGGDVVTGGADTAAK